MAEPQSRCEQIGYSNIQSVNGSGGSAGVVDMDEQQYTHICMRREEERVQGTTPVCFGLPLHPEKANLEAMVHLQGSESMEEKQHDI